MTPFLADRTVGVVGVSVWTFDGQMQSHCMHVCTDPFAVFVSPIGQNASCLGRPLLVRNQASAETTSVHEQVIDAKIWHAQSEELFRFRSDRSKVLARATTGRR